MGSSGVRFLGIIVRWLPARAALAFGDFLGGCAYRFSRRRRQTAYVNLRAALGKEKSPEELARLARMVFLNLGRNFVEVLRIPLLDEQRLRNLVTVEGLEPVEEARRRGEGIVFLTAHFGNWELASLTMAVRGWRMAVLVREQRYTRLNQLLERGRRRWGVRVLNKGADLRDLVRVLKEGETLGALLDQSGGKNSPFVDFFGRPASTPEGTIALAWKRKARIFPVFIVRQADGTHRLCFEPALKMPETEDREAAVHDYLQSFAAVLESYVRRFPDQWLWPHKRWKATPVRKILILTDGKTGHLRQAQAVARELDRVLREKGLYSETEELKPEFRGGWCRMPMLPGAKTGWGRLGFLKLALTPDSYRRIGGAFGDFVISCGSAVAPLAVVLARENSARAVAVMKPGISIRYFDLVIAPRHDGLRPGPQVVVTDGAPNLVTGESMATAGEKLKTEIGREDGIRVGVLLGGDNRDYRFGPELAGKVAEELLRAAEELGAGLLVTTSRRTPPETEKVLREKLGRFPRRHRLIIAREGGPEDAVPGIMGLSRVVVVTGESISMISEAAASGKPVVVFPLEEKPGSFLRRGKHRRLVADFVRAGYVTTAPADGLAGAVIRAAGEKTAPKRLNDNALIAEGLARLV